MKTVPKTVLTVAVIAALWCGFASAQSPNKSSALALDDIRGRRIRLDDYKGKVVLLNFWATWCAPCRQEIPDLIKLQRAHRNSLQVIGITYPPENANEVRRFARRLGMNYPVAIGTKENKTVFTNSETLPVTVVIDRDGIVRDVIEGIMYADEFKEKVEPLLATVSAGESKPKPAIQKPRSIIQKRIIHVSGEGYKPASVILRRGQRAKLTFVRKVQESCGTEIVIPDYGIKRPLPLNVPVTVTLTPRRSGRFKFTCGMDMFRGTLIVR